MEHRSQVWIEQWTKILEDDKRIPDNPPQFTIGGLYRPTARARLGAKVASVLCGIRSGESLQASLERRQLVGFMAWAKIRLAEKEKGQ